MLPKLCTRKYSVFILLTGLTSIVSLAIVFTSVGTQQWIRAVARPNIEGPLPSNINHGLFKGTLIRRPVYSPYTYDLHFTCIWGQNSCAWSCASDADSQMSEVLSLVNMENPSFACIPARTVGKFAKLQTSKANGTNRERIFTNGGLWLTTIIFIAILIVALVASIILSILNSMKSPIEPIFNVQGIYVANGIALIANILALTMYGLAYHNFIKEDVAIFDTLIGDYWSYASLHYSYWILFVPCAFHMLGIFLIAMRELIVNRDRAETKIDVANDLPETGALF